MDGSCVRVRSAAFATPIYAGGILVFGGFSLAFSAWGLLLTGLLAVLWFFKSRHEEALLLERFPEYAEYRRETWF
jgi:protein-S-isoprenylcysteine O-methyltransferase Ste14